MGEEVGPLLRQRGRHLGRDVHIGQRDAGGERLSAFEDATAVVADGDGFAWHVPDGWQQGRGAWGGLVVGALARAVAAIDTDRPLRSVSLQIVAPAVVGSHRIQVESMRIGSAVSTWSARLDSSEGQPVASLVAVTGAARREFADDQGSWGVGTAPVAPAASAVPRVPGGPPFPVFTQHIDMRPVSGLPLSGAPAESVGWVGFGEPTSLDAVALLALVDAWWPASLSRVSTMPRVATVTFAATLLIDPAREPVVGPLLHHSFVSGATEGFTSEQRRLWTADGRLAVDNLQTVVVGS